MAGCIWRSRLTLEYRCKEQVPEEGQLCNLHSSDPLKDPSEFLTRVKEKHQAGDLDFRGALFPADVSFPGDLKEADFAEAKFHGRADFHRARFSNGVDFSNAVFQGDTDFLEAVFHGRVRFRFAEFWA